MLVSCDMDREGGKGYCLRPERSADDVVDRDTLSTSQVEGRNLLEDRELILGGTIGADVNSDDVRGVLSVASSAAGSLDGDQSHRNLGGALLGKRHAGESNGEEAGDLHFECGKGLVLSVKMVRRLRSWLKDAFEDESVG